MASAKKTSKGQGKQRRVQVRDMSPRKNAKGGTGDILKREMTTSLQGQKILDINQQKVSPQINSGLKF